jgi:two-component system alkaline phosphatase synthesis response regulator PhoP
MAQKIYVLDDDDGIRELVSSALNQAGFETTGFSESAAFWKAMKTPPSLLLLDIMLPGEDGISILKRLKADAGAKTPATKQMPVIMLSARGAEYDSVKGLELGADDYIAKPFSAAAITARVRAVLRRYEASGGDAEAETVIESGGLSLNLGKCSLSLDDVDIPLASTEFKLLRCLMQAQGLLLTRNKLLDELWGLDYVGKSRALDLHVKSLRQKLGAAGERIKTVRGAGYKFEAAK